MTANSESHVVLETNLPLPLYIRGKVRDTYDLGDHLLIIASDRISAFDVILPCGIPRKGNILNQLSAFWMLQTTPVIANHMVETIDNVENLDRYIDRWQKFEYPAYLSGRSMIVKKARRIPVECVVRGYLAGSAWLEYQQTGSIAGIDLPVGLVESQQLPAPVFTPTTKADSGHDIPMAPGQLVELVGSDMAARLKKASIDLYNYALALAYDRGIIIADTKFEFGTMDDQLIIIDEMITPDSSRFWDINAYKAGYSQDSFDKQPVRDWLSASGWDKNPPAPCLPDDIIIQTSRRYLKAYQRLTGARLT